jgi:hypothetical protein
VTYGETLEEAHSNAREAIELCLEVMREDGQPIPPPDRDLASPIEQLMAVAAADAIPAGRRSPVHRHDLPPGTPRAILRQARLSRVQFLDLL